MKQICPTRENFPIDVKSLIFPWYSINIRDKQKKIRKDGLVHARWDCVNNFPHGIKGTPGYSLDKSKV